MHLQNFLSFSGNPLGLAFAPLLVVVVLWTLYWKGRALWKAARQSDTIWFVVLLIVNTVGILEILYIYVFSKKQNQ